MRQALLFLVGLGLPFFGGCFNDYAKFYTDMTGGVDVLNDPEIVAPTGEPNMYDGSDWLGDAERMLENGYFLIGYSLFNNNDGVSPDGAFKQAVAVHAETVLLYKIYAGTHTAVLTLPLTTSESTSGFFSGTVDSTHVSGNFSTHTTRTELKDVPFRFRRYDYGATYWAKIKKPIFGAYYRPLSPELRDRLESNKGAVVTATVRRSPAFIADILPGDIILRLAGQEVLDGSNISTLVNKHAGRNVEVEIYRNGKTIKKPIKLNPKP